HRLAYSHGRMDYSARLGADEGRLFFFESRPALVRVGVVERGSFRAHRSFRRIAIAGAVQHSYAERQLYGAFPAGAAEIEPGDRSGGHDACRSGKLDSLVGAAAPVHAVVPGPLLCGAGTG